MFTPEKWDYVEIHYSLKPMAAEVRIIYAGEELESVDTFWGRHVSERDQTVDQIGS